jgi:L-lysine epsilon oxidase-like protein
MFQHSESAPAPNDAAAAATPPCDCGKDPIAALKVMFVDMVQARRIAAGQDPAQRPVFLRLHGVAHGTFEVQPDLPDDLRVGVFAHRSFPAWVRFSSDLPSGSDFKSTVGVGIKLFDVPGEKLLEPDTHAPTQDFIFQNFDVFFVDTAKDMCEFTYAGVVQRNYDAYLKEHPKTAKILNDMAKVVPSVLGTPYWAILPFAFGEDRYVKYKIEPETIPGGPLTPPDPSDPFYMHADLRRRLGEGESRFRFLIQLRTDPEGMPLDQATVRWDEAQSPFVHVATLVLPRQDIGERGQGTYGENLAYNIWHALPEHSPAGSIADARKVVYRASAELRRNVNGVPVGEPTGPRPDDVEAPPGKDSRIVRAAIHPAIGVARLGNSPNDYFIGPEVVAPPPAEAGSSRDGSGALKRQAARFRIYGYNAAGQVVAELTPGNADIRWTVHVATKKAAWYQFILAMDVPEAATVQENLRNADVKGEARRSLVLDPGAKSIAGRSTWGSQYALVAQGFGNSAVSVYLGELRTDEAGRLLFLGGRGVSASPDGKPIWDGTNAGFPNADGWYDDTSDGPVTAEVNVGGRPIPVEPAWVVTAPPNYARDVIAVRTLYDLLYDTFVQAGRLPFPEQVSFTRHVFPILERLHGLQWVNKGFAAQFGWGGRNDFLDPQYLRRLASRSETWAELRRQVFNSFRDPNARDNDPLPWPWIYGDAMSVPAADTPRQNLSLSPTQYRLLRLWAEGRFEEDWDPDAKVPHQLADVPLADQPAMLDQAALHFCVADAFHPGCELTWPMRHASMYAAPFRIRRRPAGEPEPDYGPQLTQTIALRPGGPLYAQGPGDLSRWMAIPWQMDTAFCRSGYEPEYDPYLPTFWPARVPNQVLAVEEYRQVVDRGLPRSVRQAAFSKRRSWTRLLKGSTIQQMTQMVSDFGKMGVVEVRPGAPDDPDFPPVMMVETPYRMPEPEPEREAAREPERVETAEVAPAAPERVAAAAPEPEAAAEARRSRLLEEAGWESEEVAADFIRAVRAVTHS